MKGGDLQKQTMKVHERRGENCGFMKDNEVGRKCHSFIYCSMIWVKTGDVSGKSRD